MTTILTAQLAKQARESLRLSQGKVSSALGINRTYLSLFESGKYIFDDHTLDELLLYYEGLGYGFETDVLDENDGTDSYPLSVNQEEGLCRLQDCGLVVPAGLSEEHHAALLGEYEANRLMIDDLAAQEVERGWFGDWFDEPGEAEKLKLLTLMARNYSIYEEMQGHDAVKSCGEDSLEAEKDTVGELVGVMFTKVVGGG